MTKVFKSDFSEAAKDIAVLDNEDSDARSLEKNITNFTEETVAATGMAFNTLKEYLRTIVNPINELREKIVVNLQGNGKSACNSLESYMESYTLLDDSKIDSTRAEYKRVCNEYSEAISELKKIADKNSNEAKGWSTAARYHSYSKGLYRMLLRKLEGLNDADAAAFKYMDETISLLDDYISKVNEYSGLSGNLDSYTLSPSAKNKTTVDDGTEHVPLTDEDDTGTRYIRKGNDGSSGGDSTDLDTSNISQVVTALFNLVGYTSQNLANDVNNGVYNSNNYKENESWNVKFVNDWLNRNTEIGSQVKDYYEDSTTYPDPYNSAESLLKYALNDNSGMSFHWSDSALSTIQETSGLTSGTSYNPKEGDVVFFDTDGEFSGDTSNLSSVKRVAVIESLGTRVDENGNVKSVITVVEGDVGNDPSTSVVVRRIIELDSSDILGFASIKETTNNSVNI